jgi:hypothetical protein
MDRAKAAWQDASPTLFITAAVISVAGGGAASGLIVALLRPRPAGIEDVVTVASAFLATWPMSIALAVITIGALAGVGDRIGPYGSLAAVAVILTFASGIAYAATATTHLDQGAAAPLSPVAQIPQLGSPAQNLRAIALAFDDFAKLYGTNLFAGGAAGIGVGIFSFDFSTRLTKS